MAKGVWGWLLSSLVLFWPAGVPGMIPVTSPDPWLVQGSYARVLPTETTGQVPDLEDFSLSLPQHGSDRVVGAYVKGKLAIRVLEQPAGHPGYVTSQPEAASHFKMPQAYGTVGLIAHDTLAGAAFSNLKVGDEIILFYENGGRGLFVVRQVRKLQALSPWSPTSAFREVNGPPATLSALSLFDQVYGGGYPLVLQTCITEHGNHAWGRLFVLAESVSNTQESALARKLARQVAEAG